jgi:hypothetical protein
MTPGRRGLLVAAGGAAALAAFVAVLPLPAAAQAADPVVTLDRTGTAAGDQMLVTGAGWPVGASVLVELCGQGGLRGSADCDMGNQTIAGVGSSGTFTTALNVALPPVPCPCVVKVTDQASSLSATAEIAVQGVPTLPITRETLDLPERRIEVSSMEITGGSWTELFGLPAERTLAVTVVNTGAVAIEDPAVAIAWGGGDRPTGLVDPPDLEPMEPGATQTFQVDLPASGFAFGRRTATVEVQGLGEAGMSEASTSTHPWALLAIALVACQLLLLRIRNRVRRRLEPAAIDGAAPPPALPPGPPPDPDPNADTDADEVIDLRDPPEAEIEAEDAEEAEELVEVEEVEEVEVGTEGGEQVEATHRNGSTPDHTPAEATAVDHHVGLLVAAAAAAAAARSDELEAELSGAEKRLAELELDASTRLAEVDARLAEARLAAQALLCDAEVAAATVREEVAAECAAVSALVADLRERHLEASVEHERALQAVVDHAEAERARVAEPVVPPSVEPTADLDAEPLDELDRRLAAALARALSSD